MNKTSWAASLRELFMAMSSDALQADSDQFQPKPGWTTWPMSFKKTSASMQLLRLAKVHASSVNHASHKDGEMLSAKPNRWQTNQLRQDNTVWMSIDYQWNYIRWRQHMPNVVLYHPFQLNEVHILSWTLEDWKIGTNW